MVVLITTSGQVTKRTFQFQTPVDEGLAEFARVYLNERLVGEQLGTRRVAAAFDSADLRPKERAFFDVLRPAFATAGPGDVEGLHLGGTSRLLDNLTRAGAGHLNEVLQMLEERYNLLELLAGALREDGVYLRIGHEMPQPIAAGVLARVHHLRRGQPQPGHGERHRPDADGLPARHLDRAGDSRRSQRVS